MTKKLDSMLKTKIAVVSCMRDYVSKKERPSRKTAVQIQKYGAEISYTDCFTEKGFRPQYHNEVLITVDGSGEISTQFPVNHRNSAEKDTEIKNQVFSKNCGGDDQKIFPHQMSGSDQAADIRLRGIQPDN